MSLRSGTSFWLQQASAPPLPANALTGDEKCELAILGGGITGALIADRMTRRGVNAILIDKRELGTGSTAASTGLLQYEVDTPLVDLISIVGEAVAVRAYRRGLTAIDEIEQLTHELGEDCGFSRHETLCFASHWWHRRRLEREAECRQAHGMQVEFLARAALRELTSLSASGAIRSRGSAQVDPYQLTQVLLRRAVSQGLRAFSKSEVIDIQENARGVLLRTVEGSVTARRIVYATGYDSHRYLPADEGRLHCTYVLVSEPLRSTAGWPDGMLIWETARPYFYARRTPDGRAMIGGADTAFASDHRRDSLIARRVRGLQRRFGKLFPAIQFVPAYAWAGTFGESKDGLAYIGQARDRPLAYFAVGYGGNGITFGMIAARLITDLYFGQPNADAEVFRFGR